MPVVRAEGCEGVNGFCLVKFPLTRIPLGQATLRAIAWMETHGPCSAHDLADAIHTAKRNAQWVLTNMRAADWAHIKRWKQRRLGELGNHTPMALWSLGKGKDAPKPARRTQVQIQSDRKKRIEARFGPDAAKVLRSRSRGGSSVLRVEGETLYQRGQPRGRNGGRRAQE